MGIIGIHPFKQGSKVKLAIGKLKASLAHRDEKISSTVYVKFDIESHKVFPKRRRVYCVAIFDHDDEIIPSSIVPMILNC